MADDPEWYRQYTAANPAAAAGPTQTPSPLKAPSAGGSDPDVGGYIRQAAAKRGIDPETAIKVAQSEGGLVPNRTGVFKTGQSFWPFQLHYGGPGYEKFGNVAGMGNSFTAQTGYQPGDPNAWQAATDYALDAAAKNGWGAWYGARNVGVTGRQGIGAAPAQTAPAAPITPAADRSVSDEDPEWYRQFVAQQGRGSAPTVQSASRGEGVGPSADGSELWPVVGQRWGQVNNPFGGGQARSAGATVALPAYNTGADLTAKYGTEVVAPVSGTVVEVFDAPDERDRNANRGWGGMTLLKGDNGYFYRLSHAQPGSVAARPGQRVEQGQYLQRVGVSGNTTGAHLDYEKFDAPGHFVDPVTTRGTAVSSPSGGAVAPDISSLTVDAGDPAWFKAFVAQQRGGR